MSKVSTKIYIVNPDTKQVCSENEVGEIWLSSNESNLELPNESTDNFVKTGKMGFLVHDKLYISCKLDETILYKNHRIFPQDLEIIAESAHPLLKNKHVIAFNSGYDLNGEVIILCELKNIDANEYQNLFKQIQINVSKSLDLPIAKILIVQEFPTANDKQEQRTASKDAYLNEHLNVLGSWENDSNKPDEIINLKEHQSWLSKFLVHGYKEEHLFLKMVHLQQNQATGEIEVDKFYMPSDGHFHLNVFNSILSLIQLINIYCQHAFPTIPFEEILFESIDTTYNHPINDPHAIPIELTVATKTISTDHIRLDVTFFIGEKAFSGNATILVPTASPIAKITPLTLNKQTIDKMLPVYLHDIYRNDNYDFQDIRVNKKQITAQVMLSFHEEENIQFLKWLFLINIIVAQLSIIYACWYTQMKTKSGEFYAIRMLQFINQKLPISNQNFIKLELADQLFKPGSIIYMLSSSVNNDLIQGEFYFAVPNP